MERCGSGTGGMSEASVWSRCRDVQQVLIPQIGVSRHCHSSVLWRWLTFHEARRKTGRSLSGQKTLLRKSQPRPKKTKKGKRAASGRTLQLSSNGKATLIPIAILIDGKFHDASVYKADPVPMALDGGTVYEVEQTGESQGLFTIKGALHSKSPGTTSPWLGVRILRSERSRGCEDNTQSRRHASGNG